MQVSNGDLARDLSNVLRFFTVKIAVHTTTIHSDTVEVSHCDDDDDATAHGHDGLYCGDVY